MNKKQIKTFLRTTAVSSVIIACVFFSLFAFCEIYENIRYIGYGEYKNAIELTEDGIRILDFVIG